MKVLRPMSGFPAWVSGKGTRNPHRNWLWRPGEFDYRTSTELGETETPILEGTNKILCVPRPRAKEQSPQKTTCLVLEGLLWRLGLAMAHCSDGGTGSSSPRRCPLAHEPSWSSPLTGAYRLQGWVTSVQKLPGRSAASPISRQSD